MVLTKISSGSKWRYTKRDGQYFTYGSTYEVLCDENEDGQFRIQDDTGNGRHHWTNEPDFYAHFERADGPIRTRKEIVPGTYGQDRSSRQHQRRRAGSHRRPAPCLPASVAYPGRASRCCINSHRTCRRPRKRDPGMTNPSETRDSELTEAIRMLADDADAFAHIPAIAALTRRAREAADTIDRLTSTGEAVLRVPFNWIAVLGDARNAIASLDEGALGYFEKAPHHHWPLRDELLANIDKALADPAASPREGHVEVPVEPPEAEALLSLIREEAAKSNEPVGRSDSIALYNIRAALGLSRYGAALPHNQGETKP
jgi:hypothetical protein